MDKINWGIIGCGDVTEVKSGPAFNKVPNSALVAVMRRDRLKVLSYAKRHNVPKWYTNADELINDPDVDAIYIATPPSSHEEYAVKAINAGKPVYLEKPMALNYTAAKNIAALAADKNIPFVVAHYRREQPLFKKIKELVATKEIGEIRYIKLQLNRTPLTEKDLADPKIAWRVDPTIAGSGLFYDLAPHQLDLMYYFFGPITSASGVSSKQGNKYNAIDMVAGNILFKSGAVFSGSWCFNAPFDADECEIIGSKGRISFSFFSGSVINVLIDGAATGLMFESLQHAQQPMIEATVNYFLKRSDNPCSAKDGEEVMRIMDSFTKQ